MNYGDIMAHWYKNKKLLAVINISASLLIILSIGVGIVKNNTSRADFVNANIDAQCRKKPTIPKDYYDKISKYLLDTYNKQYPIITSTTTGVDFDTYSTSWDKYVDGKAEGIKIKNELKNGTESILNTITDVIGDPYSTGRIVVVYTPDLVKDNNLNPYGMDDVGGMYIPSLRLLLLADKVTKELFVHELVHTYNAALPVEAIEEGMAESVAQIVSMKLWSNSTDVVINAPTSKRIMLGSPFGYFRTLRTGQNNLTSDRYEAAASLMLSLYNSNSDFYQNFRSNIRQLPQFSQLISDSQTYLANDIIQDTLCAEIAQTSGNSLKPFVASIEKLIIDSLPKDMSKLMVQTNPNNPLAGYSDNPILNIYPNKEARFDIKLHELAQYITVFATEPLSDQRLLDQLYAVYSLNPAEQSDVSTERTNYINMEKLSNLAGMLNGGSRSVMQNLSTSLEHPATLSEIKYSSPDSLTEYIVDISTPTDLYEEIGGTESYGTTISGNYYKDTAEVILSKLGLPPNYNGSVKLDLQSKNVSYKVDAKKSCAGIGVLRYCWPDGIKATPYISRSKTSETFKVKDGKMISLRVPSPTISSPSEITLTLLGSSQLLNNLPMNSQGILPVDIKLEWDYDSNDISMINSFDIYRDKVQVASILASKTSNVQRSEDKSNNQIHFEYTDQNVIADSYHGYYVVAKSNDGVRSNDSKIARYTPLNLTRSQDFEACVDGKDIISFNEMGKIDINHINFRPIGTHDGCIKLGNVSTVGIGKGMLNGCEKIDLKVIQGRGEIVLERDTLPGVRVKINDYQTGSSLYKIRLSCTIHPTF